MPESRLVGFYRGQATDSRGRTLAEVQGFDDRRMESVHDFIQWMFPLPEPSRFNPDAPLLTEPDIRAFRSDPLLREALAASFRRFLAFLGLALNDGGAVGEGLDFGRKQGVFLRPNHNWLRLTRVLASTRILGLEAESAALFRFLTDPARDEPFPIPPDTLRYWAGASGSTLEG